jgi:hypothetical protein
MSRKRVVVAATVAVVLFAMSPAFQGYHVGRSIGDTNCTTRFVVQFCKDEHARIAREQAAAEARTAQREAAAAAQECKTVSKEADAGRWHDTGLNAGNYYLHCLRPSVQQALIRKWEGNEHKESEQRQAQAAHKKAQLEAEAASLKQHAKALNEEDERLSHEGKYSQGFEKGEERDRVKREAEKKLEEAKEVG